MKIKSVPISILSHLWMLILPFLLYSCNYPDPPVKLKIYPEYENTLKGELVWINAEFINQTQSPLKLNSDFNIFCGFWKGGINLVIKNEHGEIIETRKGDMQMEPIERDTVFLLQPNDTLKYVFSLSQYFINTKAIKIIANYNETNSNELKIEFEEPEGNDLIAKKLWMHGENEDFENVINKYDDSRFAFPVYETYLLRLIFLDTNKFREVFNTYMTKHIESAYTELILVDYCKFLEYTYKFNIDQIKNELKNLPAQYPNGGKKLERAIKKIFRCGLYY